MKAIHGGDIYRNHVEIDFSVNVNPLGAPQEVIMALQEAIEKCMEYPDITAEKLQKKVSENLQIPKEWLLFGNGASELFMAVIHAIKPRKILISIPSFYGYEYVANTAECEIVYYDTKQEEAFRLTEQFFDVLTEDVDIVFLANPNNPTGTLMSKEYVWKVLEHCREKNIYVVLDECFIDFCGKEYSMLSEVNQFENLILIQAYTKIFAIPGVRLGYLICSKGKLLDNIKKQIPEWNLSTFAQSAGYECAGQENFIKKTIEHIKIERQYLIEHLKQLGIIIFPSETNFILIYSQYPLYDMLLKQGILIRSCENFKGLGKGFYRIAVKNRNDNERLIKEMEEIINGEFI